MSASGFTVYAYGNPTVWIDPTGHFNQPFTFDPNKTVWDPKTQTATQPDGKQYRPSFSKAFVRSRGLILFTVLNNIGGDSHDPNRRPPDWLFVPVEQPQTAESAPQPSGQTNPLHDPNTREGRERFAENNPGVTDARAGTAPPAPKKKEEVQITVESDSGGINDTVSNNNPVSKNAPAHVSDGGDAQDYERSPGSVRKQDYPTRERKQARERLENAATNSDGAIRCQSADCSVEGGRVLQPGEGTIEHNPPLVQTHNEQGYNTDQETRNDLYNDTATEIHCIDCQRRQGGQTPDRYRRDVGPNYEPRQPRRKKSDN